MIQARRGLLGFVLALPGLRHAFAAPPPPAPTPVGWSVADLTSDQLAALTETLKERLFPIWRHEWLRWMQTAHATIQEAPNQIEIPPPPPPEEASPAPIQEPPGRFEENDPRQMLYAAHRREWSAMVEAEVDRMHRARQGR